MARSRSDVWLSYGCWMRTIFLGLPIVWIFVVGMMLLNLTLENMASVNVYGRDKHHQGYQSAGENEATRLHTQAPVRAANEQEMGNPHGEPHHVSKANSRNEAVGKPPKLRDENNGPRVPFDIKKSDMNSRVKADGQQQILPGRDNGGHAHPVVDVEDLMQFPEIKRLAPIFRPAKSASAPGENGSGVNFDKESLSPEDLAVYDHGWKVNSFNQLASDRISVHRKLRDNREAGCSQIQYNRLPDTSVIICFHNEAMSVLLRTVHSVINRTPPALLKEIVLVDDFSDQEHLKAALEAYIDRLPKVRLVRTEKREGLVRARLIGYRAAKGTVLTFLDSHCECSEGWLEPLLGPIAEDPQTVVAPIIDSIVDKNMAYIKSGRSAAHIPIGVFDWNMLFHWGSIPESQKKLRTNILEPVRTPTIAGGLFSINREYFTHIGTYDAGMDIWGGENLEMSFRVWLCGGRLLIAPCSRVGHIFRKTSPYNSLPGKNVFQRNSMRAAEVWLDDYKQYFYERINYRLVDVGDVSDRLALKKRLKCHPFEWYLKNIYPELYVPSDTTAGGEVINVNSGICLEVSSKTVRGPLKTHTCHGQGGNQFWLLTTRHQIRRDNHCVRGFGPTVDVEPCNETSVAQQWLYREDQTLFHIQTETCMELDKLNPVLAKCSGSRGQRWMWQRRKPASPANNNNP